MQRLRQLAELLGLLDGKQFLLVVLKIGHLLRRQFRRSVSRQRPETESSGDEGERSSHRHRGSFLSTGGVTYSGGQRHGLGGPADASSQGVDALGRSRSPHALSYSPANGTGLELPGLSI